MLPISVPATAQQDTWVGNWKLNLAKSKFEPANLAPKSQDIKQEVVAGSGLKSTVDAQGQTVNNVAFFDRQ